MTSTPVVRRLALLVVPLALTVGCTDSGTTTGTNAGPAVEATSGPGGNSSTTAKGAKTTTTDASSETTDTTGDTDTTKKSSTTTRSKTTETVQTSEPTDPAELPDACDLLTEEDAEAAFGEPPLGGDQRTDECWWSTKNDLKVINLIRRTDDVDEWRAGYQNDSWEPVDRGDEGYAGKVLSSIVFRIGDVQYEINVNYSTKGDPDQVVNDLADKVLARLG